jgi:tape measure domain-containing protein
MTTITALNVRLGMDVSNFSEGANLAKAEVNRVAGIMRQSVPASEKYKKDLDLLNRAFSETGKKSAEYANALEHLNRKHQQAAQATSAAASATRESVSATSAAISSVKRLAMAYLGLQTVTKAIKLATEVEDATVAFEVLTGSVNDGKLLFQQIRTFSEQSPITFSGAAQATRTMMSFGVAAQDIQKNLQMLSDVTGGNNDRFKMLSLAFAQMSAAGRLMGQDLLQMINAGFNPLQQISKTTGESLVALKKRMEEGGIATQEVRQAFIDATSEGGMFHGMTERLAQTMGGKLNIALSQLEKGLAAAGQALAPLVIALTDGFEQGASWLNAVVNVIEGVTDGLGMALAIAKDLFNLDFDMTAINKFLDTLEARDRERLAAANATATAEKFEKEKDALQAVAEIDHKAIEAAQKARLKAVAEWEKARKKAIESAQKERLKAIEQAARAERDAQRAFQQELSSARQEAIRFFQSQMDAKRKMREDVSKGPGGGIEAGSAEAVKFVADQINQQIGAKTVQEEMLVTNRDIAKKTAELLLAQREENEHAEAQIELSRRILAEMQNNGFRRIR